MGRLLATIEIPKFITKVEISKKRRAKYYKKGGKKPIPKTKLAKYKFNKQGYLVDEHGAKIIANPRTAGKPKYEMLSGNNLISGYGSRFTRPKIVRELKNFYRPFVQEYIRKHGQLTTFPLKIMWDLYTIVDEKDPNWDASNLSFYNKYFEDSLFEKTDEQKNYPLYKGKKLLQLIPDDNVKYITFPASPKLIPVNKWEDRKFVFKIYHDDRKELNRKPWK